MLADFLDIDASLIVTMHIQSIDQNAAIKQIKRKITDLDKTKMEEQKRAVRAGYDMDILPSDLAYLRRGGQKAAGGSAKPKRAHVSGHVSGAQHRYEPAGA